MHMCLKLKVSDTNISGGMNIIVININVEE